MPNKLVRLALVRVANSSLLALIKGNPAIHTSNYLPDDLQVIAVKQPRYATCNWFYAIVHSRTFDAVPEDSELSEIGYFNF